MSVLIATLQVDPIPPNPFAEWMARIAMIVLPLLGAALLAAAGVSWRRRDMARHGAAWRSMARGLGLKWFDRWQLERLARDVGARYPATVVLSRDAFDRAAGTPPRTPALVALRQRVFD